MQTWKHVYPTPTSHKLRALWFTCEGMRGKEKERGVCVCVRVRERERRRKPEGTINLTSSSSTSQSRVAESCTLTSFLFFSSFFRYYRRSSPCAVQALEPSTFLWTCCTAATVAPAVYTTCFFVRVFLSRRERVPLISI